MKFGIQLNPYHGTHPWPDVEKAARAVDAARYDSLWLYDHLLYEGGYSGHPVTEPVMECFTTLGGIAAITKRVRLGQLVLGTPYRNPALTAKMATTLDHISNGRSILGLGAGWHQREHEAYGYGPFEEIPVRMKRLEEGIKVTLKLWTENPATFKGRYYELQAVKENPATIQRPHPPLLIGGSGEKVTLRLVAQYGQFCNISGDPETVERRLGILREHCDRLGRPYDQVTKSIYTTVLIGKSESAVQAKHDRLAAYVPRNGALVGTPAQLVDQLGAYAKAGAEYVIFRTPDWQDVEPLQLFSEEVIPKLG